MRIMRLLHFAKKDDGEATEKAAAESRQEDRIVAFLAEEEDRQLAEVRERLGRVKKELEAHAKRERK